MIRVLYSIFMWAIQPLVRRKLRRRGAQEPGYLHDVEARFGHYGSTSLAGAPDEARPLWVHAVSLGEVRAAAILLRALREQRPHLRILLTHGTATGWNEGSALLREGDRQTWLPWDTPGAVGRFLAHHRPAAGVLMETEIWPNLLFACAQAGVPVALANARLNPKSQGAARRWAWLMRPAYASLHAVWSQTDADAQRLRSVGAPVDRPPSAVLGSVKFDVHADPARTEQGRAWRRNAGRPVVCLSVSREGEETAFLRAWAQEPLAHGLQALIVPRHPQRFDEVASLIEASGMGLSRRSHWEEGPPAHARAVWLGDSLGEMGAYYSASDVALLGGSFEPLGGQNLIEAAAYACPVVMGPHTFNFAEAARLSAQAGAALRVPDMTQGVRAACEWALDLPRQRTASAAATQFQARHRGAAQAMAGAALAMLTSARRR